MDKTLPTNLDPKLKEVYERVMGTPTAKSGVIPPLPTPAPAAVQPPPKPQAPAPQTPVQPTMMQATPNTSGPATSSTTFVAQPPATKPKISPVIIIVGGVAFFIAYVLFWLSFFGVPIPFLSP